MTIQTMFDTEATAVEDPGQRTLADRLAGTPLDFAKGRQREYKVIYALTLLVLLLFFTVARIVTFAHATGPRRSVLKDAKSAASSALAYAYRH